jgi:hypothetical protein
LSFLPALCKNYFVLMQPFCLFGVYKRGGFEY